MPPKTDFNTWYENLKHKNITAIPPGRQQSDLKYRYNSIEREMRSAFKEGRRQALLEMRKKPSIKDGIAVLHKSYGETSLEKWHNNPAQRAFLDGIRLSVEKLKKLK